MRKKIEKISALFIIACAVIFAAAYLYLVVMGQALLSDKLAGLTRRKVKIGYFSVAPDLKIIIRDLDIRGLARVKSVSAYPSITGLFRGKLIFNQLTLVRPEIFFNKTPPEVTDTKISTATIIPSVSRPAESQAAAAGLIPLGAVRLDIKDGSVIFIDQTVSSGSIKITVKDINSSVSNLYLYPGPAVTKFWLKAAIPWGDKELQGGVELEGWLDSLKKNIQATLKVSNIDAVYLYPYYSYWVDLGKARIEKARLNFTSKIRGVNNDVTANCHLELSDMVRKPLEIGESEEKASKVTNVVLDTFKNMDQGRVELNFAIKTKMDSPRFGFDNFKSAFEDKIAQGRNGSGFKLHNAVGLPAKMVGGGMKGFADLGKAMVDGLIAIGSEIGKIGGEMLKKEPLNAKQ